jgi:hypothetical protein
MSKKITGVVRKTFRMKKEQLANWLAALRSGKYKQCESILHNNEIGGYCCLGVLQHVTDGDVEQFVHGGSRHLPTPKWLEDNGIKNLESSYKDNIYTYVNACKGSKEPSATASSLNDGLKLTFPEIADILEASCEAY